MRHHQHLNPQELNQWSSASSSSPDPGEFNPWISDVTEDTLVLTSTGGPVTCGER